jgi:tetratricopeptide (TPR) repeat protein
VKRLIELYRDSQDFEILNELYKLALSINNNHGPTLNDYGKFLNDNQYHDDAIRYLKKSLALDNKNSIRLYNYALSLIGKDEIKKSMSIYNKIIKISPYYVSAWHSKGVAHLRLNQIDKAYNCFRKAVLIDNGYVASWLNLGAICFYKKNINKALLIYNYCVKIVPESYEANKMMTETYYYMGLKDKCIYYAQITQSIDKNDQRIKEILSNLVNDI